MKIAILALICIALAIYSAEPTVSFSPFKVTFEKPYIPFALLCLIATIVLYSLQFREIGYKEGVSDTVDYFIKEIKEKESNSVKKE